MAASAHAAPDRRPVRQARIAAFAVSITAAVTGFLLFLRFGLADGLDTVDVLRRQEKRCNRRARTPLGPAAADGDARRIVYRRRNRNTGRKAGNIEDFIQTSGGAYDYAMILDADSLMEGATIARMVRRMEADPALGLLQSLARVVGARSWFGRTMQFSASFCSQIFARGLAMMQGRTGPFWGHNALVRVRAFAASCSLPELAGQAPFGGHILSHDYVEAALLARAGRTVRLDDDLDGSFEEGPENIVDHAKRDRC